MPYGNARVDGGNTRLLRDAYAAWLGSLAWDTFGTFTFRQARSVRRAGELFREFCDARGAAFSASVVVWGSEPHQSGSGHIHALVKWHAWCDPRREAFVMSDAWRERFGRVELAKYDPNRGATYYLTKYVMKESNNTGEWALETPGGVKDGSGVPPDRESLFQHQVSDGPSEEGRNWKSQEEVEEEIDREEEARRFWEEFLDEERASLEPEARGGR